MTSTIKRMKLTSVFAAISQTGVALSAFFVRRISVSLQADIPIV